MHQSQSHPSTQLRVVPISPELFYALTLFVVSPRQFIPSLNPLSRLVHILFVALFMPAIAVVFVALYFT